MKVSIVVPAYNEAAYIGACLDAIQRQTIQPYEIIVVDNHSNDKTAHIASLHKDVVIVHEPKKGRIYAEERGFALARGDVIARIDADTRLTPTWVAQVVECFKTDTSLAAVTGRGCFYNVPFGKLVGLLQSGLYQYVQYPLARGFTLWGSNMAIRREVLSDVQPHRHRNTTIDEDIDLSLLLHARGYRVAYHRDLLVHASLRRGQFGFWSTCVYLSTWPRDYFVNKRYLGGVIIAFLVVVLSICTLPVALVNSVRANIARILN